MVELKGLCYRISIFFYKKSSNLLWTLEGPQVPYRKSSKDDFLIFYRRPLGLVLKAFKFFLKLQIVYGRPASPLQKSFKFSKKTFKSSVEVLKEFFIPNHNVFYGRR